VPSTAAGNSEVNNRDRDDAAAAPAIDDVKTTSLPPEAAAPPQYPDILVTCPDAVDNGCRASADKK